MPNEDHCQRENTFEYVFYINIVSSILIVFERIIYDYDLLLAAANLELVAFRVEEVETSNYLLCLMVWMKHYKWPICNQKGEEGN